jgi:hypothetical protein
MPIPDFDHNGVLPPHVGIHAANRACMSPYACTSMELCAKLGTTAERRQILAGLFGLRAALRQLGVTLGFQWLDGSFAEDAEKTRNRPPNDIDVVTFYQPPSPRANLPAPLAALLPVITDRDATKQQFKVDHILVPLAADPDRIVDAQRLVDEARYWFGLFSHRRSDDVWKGMLFLPLDTAADDATAVNSIQVRQP